MPSNVRCSMENRDAQVSSGLAVALGVLGANATGKPFRCGDVFHGLAIRRRWKWSQGSRGTERNAAILSATQTPRRRGEWRC